MHWKFIYIPIFLGLLATVVGFSVGVAFFPWSQYDTSFDAIGWCLIDSIDLTRLFKDFGKLERKN
ncbi:unnamed protein product [Strongylus vulgaris]|uniref:Uncharacterized protein n=1 Tax=Strongylus vulgaris TaxID=40348 RepID=A0A3P7M340_STRVU|nr:unnamed protein product [Strongylus vulgaris]